MKNLKFPAWSATIIVTMIVGCWLIWLFMGGCSSPLDNISTTSTTGSSSTTTTSGSTTTTGTATSSTTTTTAAPGWVVLGEFDSPVHGPAVGFDIDGNTPGGIPYLAYCDRSDGRIVVAKYIGSAWQNLSATGYSTDPLSLVIDQEVPYLALLDGDNGFKALVIRYDTGWTSIDSWASSGQAEGLALALSVGAPYLAFNDYNANKGLLKKSNGSSWDLVGGTAFSSGPAYPISLCIYQGIPYVAFYDGKGFVKKYIEPEWQTLDAGGFSGTYIGPNLSLAVTDESALAVPYIAYVEGTAGKVKRYNGSSFVQIGSDFSATMLRGLSLNIYQGVPYLVYAEATGLWESVIYIQKYAAGDWQLVSSFAVPEKQTNHLVSKIFEGSVYIAYMEYGVGASKAKVVRYVMP